MTNLQDIGNFLNRLITLRLGHFTNFHAKSDISCNRHIRIKRIGLENHRNIALGRMQPGNRLSIDGDIPGRDWFEPGDSVQQCRLSAARRANEDEKTTLIDLDIDILQNRNVAIGLIEVGYFQKRHLQLIP